MPMGIFQPSARKHDFEGIGSAMAATLFAVMAANPATSWLTAGILGKIVFFILSKLFEALASEGVVILNVGAEKLVVANDRANFDGSLESSYRLIEEIRSSGRDLTEEEIKAIDDGVILQFRKFARLTRKKK